MAWEKGIIVQVCGRKARVVADFGFAVRVLYLEGTDRNRMLDLPFTPFEANVPKSYCTRSMTPMK